MSVPLLIYLPQSFADYFNLQEVTLLAIKLELLQNELLPRLIRLVEIIISGGVDTAAIADCSSRYANPTTIVVYLTYH